MKKSKRNKAPSLRHTFQFDESFDNLQRIEHAELKFFCEAFSLIDSMRRKDTLLRFARTIKAQKGSLECSQILKILKDENVMDEANVSLTSKDEGLHFLFDCMYEVIKKIVLDGYVTCMNTSTLGCRAWEASELYLRNSDEKNNNNGTGGLKSIPNQKDNMEKGLAWKDLAERLQELAVYQRKHKKIHHDFQKSNYAPDPRTKMLYGSTIFIIILGIVYTILRNCKFTETKEFMRLLRRLIF